MASPTHATLLKIIEQQQELIGKLTEQIVQLSTPQQVSMVPFEGPLFLSEEDEDKEAIKAFQGEDTTVDYADPNIREILEHAGALNTSIAVAD